MPKYAFTIWEESKYAIVFEADSLEHAKELAQDNLDNECNADELPNAERFFRKGDENWLIEEMEEYND
jgi:hypothetical protein